MKKSPSKVAQKNSNPLFFPYCLSFPNGSNKRIHVPNCGFRPTVYRSGDKTKFRLKINSHSSCSTTAKALQWPYFFIFWVKKISDCNQPRPEIKKDHKMWDGERDLCSLIARESERMSGEDSVKNSLAIWA